MKTNLLLLCTFLLIRQVIFAQTDSSSVLLAKYDFSILNDTTNQNANRHTDIMLLDIRKNFSIFYSYLKHLGQKQSNEANNIQISGTTVKASTRIPFADKESEYIEINYEANNYKVYDWISKQPHYYEDSLIKPQWVLWPDTVTILNVPCQKATTSYRGRNIIAWFAKNIPLQYGPWLYNGLPGLIMKLEDDRNQFSFICREIVTKVEKEPAFVPYKNPEKISKKLAQERKRLRQEDPIASSQKEWGISFSYGDSNKPHKKRAYNPIELQ
ncbi:MAG: GLPGLI family protein [Ferruginibacter sp.]|nr:GLPGLI family protein [Ferruginibacter sp.]